MKQSYLYNQMVRVYNRSRSKLQSLIAAGKNLRRQDILKRRIARLFNLLSGMQYALKTGAAAMVLTAGMALFQPNAAQAQITFGPVQTNPFGLSNIPYGDGPSLSTFVDLNGDGRLDIMSAAGINDFYYSQNTGTNTIPTFGAPIFNPFGLNVAPDNPILTFADLDNDGDMDLLASDWGIGPFKYYQNTGTATFPVFAAPVINPFGLTSLGQGCNATFVDLDNDGDFDLMVGTDDFMNGGFKYFKNTGTKTAPAFAPVATNPFGLIPADFSSNIAFADLDSDGDLDILSGKYWGDFAYYQNTGTITAPAFAASVNNPFGLSFPGIRLHPEFGDLDNDGDMDLLLTQYDDYNRIWYIENTTCHAATAPAINTPAVNCGFQNNTLTILTGSLNDAAQWVWYSDSCGGNGTNFVGTGTSVTVAQSVTTTYFVRGEGGCAPKPGNCGSVTITVNNPATWYADLDKDGFGNLENQILACTQPTGYVANHTDCDDANASVLAPQLYYVDADLDGYGSAATALFCSFTAPEGYSVNTGDCDDANANVYPDANEVCGNGTDDNCNGLTDEGCTIITVSPQPASVTEGNAGKKDMIFTVSLNAPATQNCSVDYKTIAVTATEGVDYKNANGTLSFAPGETSKTVTVRIIGDVLDEQDETFRLKLHNAVQLVISPKRSTGTIINDDARNIAAIAVMKGAAANPATSVKVSPNPAISFINVELTGYTGYVTIRFRSMEGKVIKQEKWQTGQAKSVQQKMVVAGLTGGVYLLTATDEKGNMQTEKVIIAH